jgi:hypothetical protein
MQEMKRKSKGKSPFNFSTGRQLPVRQALYAQILTLHYYLTLTACYYFITDKRGLSSCLFLKFPDSSLPRI